MTAGWETDHGEIKLNHSKSSSANEPVVKLPRGK